MLGTKAPTGLAKNSWKALCMHVELVVGRFDPTSMDEKSLFFSFTVITFFPSNIQMPSQLLTFATVVGRPHYTTVDTRNILRLRVHGTMAKLGHAVFSVKHFTLRKILLQDLLLIRVRPKCSSNPKP